MKTEAYCVMIVIDLTKKLFVPAPISRCGCPAGLGGCSHLRAQYAIFASLQKILKQRVAQAEEFTRDDALAIFPPSMHNMRKLPIPFTYAFQDDDIDKELKSAKRQRESQQQQMGSEVNNLLLNLNSGDGVPESDCESKDNDDNSYSPSNKESIV